MTRNTTMKRFLASALVLGAVTGFGLVGCSDTQKVEDKQTVSGPGGTTTTTVEKEVSSSGSNPPANTAGETGSGTAAPK